jgi:hypothetical protein
LPLRAYCDPQGCRSDFEASLDWVPQQALSETLPPFANFCAFCSS